MGYTAEDENLIKEKWDDLLLSCTKICKNDEDWNFIKRAFFLAKEAHEGVRRRSGEPYLLHPIAVAKIVIEEIGLGVKSVVAALLHDVVEDTEYSVEDMERIFGPKIASMVDGLTKMSGVFNADTSEQAEYFRKVLLTLSDDVRVILIKIADRLHNMRTLGAMPMNKQIKITGETIYLFAPLAYRLGLYSIKSELEDLCMKYRFPYLSLYFAVSVKLPFPFLSLLFRTNPSHPYFPFLHFFQHLFCYVFGTFYSSSSESSSDSLAGGSSGVVSSGGAVVPGCATVWATAPG